MSIYRMSVLAYFGDNSLKVDHCKQDNLSITMPQSLRLSNLSFLLPVLVSHYPSLLFFLLFLTYEH
jgi:hypothetical protein